MKILATGDFHGDSRQVQKLAEKAVDENVDVILICGDILHAGNPVDGMMKPFVDTGKKVFFIPGNHDGFATADFYSELYKVKNLHSSSYVIGDTALFGVGGANVGIDQLSETELFEGLEKGHEGVKSFAKKISVSHVHPSGTKVENLSRYIPGSDGVRKAIDAFQPDIHICCHIHEAEGLEEQIGKTKVLNVGRTGKIFEV